MATIIRYNGSRFAGSSHASIDVLLQLMEIEPLNWEMFGSFVNLTPNGSILIFGNFLRISHAFAIETDDKDLLKSFAAAIDINHQLSKKQMKDEVLKSTIELMMDKSIPESLLNKPF